MADSTIPNLTAATALTGAELFYVVQGGNDRKATAAQIQAFSGITVGSSTITSGTTGRLLYDNAGIVGEALLTYSAAQLQLGAADAAAPIAQTIGVQNVVGGTSNTAGANATINGSRGTGTGAGGSIIMQVAPAGSSGTSQNPLSTALTLASTLNWAFTGQAFSAATLTGVSMSLTSSGRTDFTIDAAGTNICALNFSQAGTVTWNYFCDASVNFNIQRVGIGNIVQIFGDGSGVNIRSATPLSWNNDLILRRAAAATLQFGAADAASPIAQTTQVQNVAAGNSNVNGANWTLNGSVSTGTGTSGDIIFQTGGTGAGATSQNAEVTALTIKGATQQVILATNLRINVAPTINGSASTTITSGADSSTNLGHRISFNLNGTTYWIPCGSVAF